MSLKLLAELNRAPLSIAAKRLQQSVTGRGVNTAYTHPVFNINFNIQFFN